MTKLASKASALAGHLDGAWRELGFVLAAASQGDRLALQVCPGSEAWTYIYEYGHWRNLAGPLCPEQVEYARSLGIVFEELGAP